MIIQCVVACSDCDGPNLVPVIVSCNQEQYDNGDHYDAAKKWAEEQDYEGPMLVFDENDSTPLGFFDLFDWSETGRTGCTVI